MMKLQTAALYSRMKAAGRVKNKLTIARRGGGTWPTVHRFTSETDTQAQLVNLAALGRFLVQGLGISPAELRDMRVGELFEIPDQEKQP